jgi:trimethylamine:corrinoid methyltransferase-like protein
MKDRYRLNIPKLNILSDDQLEFLHLSTLEALRRTGVGVKEPKALGDSIKDKLREIVELRNK